MCFFFNIVDIILLLMCLNSLGFGLQIRPDDAFGHQMIINLEVRMSTLVAATSP